MIRSPELQTRRLLVTGGAGFIGSHFVEHCLEQGLVERLVVLDSLTYAADLCHSAHARRTMHHNCDALVAHENIHATAA